MSARVPSSTWRWLRRGVVAGALLGITVGGCGPTALGPTAGRREYEEPAFVTVPGGAVNVAGGNFLHERTDLEIDTRLGTISVGAAYNSATGWLWSLDVRYLNGVFTDATGAQHNATNLANGAAIPGTHWVRVDASSIKTKGGLLHEFDATSGRLLVVRWTSSAYPRLVYAQETIAGVALTTAIDQCTSATSCTNVFSMQYDASARLTQITDRAGRTALFTYDADGRLASARDGLDVQKGWPGFRYEYISGSTASLAAAIVNSEGERIELVNDGALRVTRATAIGAGNPATIFTYGLPDAAGVYATTVTDPRGNASTYRYDVSRRLLSMTNPLSEVTSWTWSNLRPASMMKPDGTQTSWTYSNDDVATETAPSGNVLTFTYNSSGVDRDKRTRRPIATIDDSIGKVEARGYDPNGRVVWVENGVSERTNFSYGTDEMVAQIAWPNGATRHFQNYGDHGHATQVSVDGVTWAYPSYDSVGNNLAGPLPKPLSAGVQLLGYDADRNVETMQVYDRPLPPAAATAQTITIENRSDRRVKRVTRPYSGETVFTFDPIGRPISISEKVSGSFEVTTYSYDAASNPTARELPNGMRAEYAYDAAGRVTGVRWLQSGVVESDVTFTYSAGQLVRTQDVARSFDETYAYDSAGRLRSPRYSAGESAQLSYDVRSRVAGIDLVNSDGTTLASLSSVYDLDDRELQFKYFGSALATRTYVAGVLDSTAYGNGLMRRHFRQAASGYEVARELWRGTARLERSDYGRAPTVQGELGSQTTTVTNSASALNLVTSENYSWVSAYNPPGGDRRLGSGPSSIGDLANSPFYFDHLSNITSERNAKYLLNWQPANLEHQFNAERTRLVTSTYSVAGFPPATRSYGYDAAGFQTSMTPNSGSAMTLSWNARGQIASIAVGGSVVASFSYDAVGRRREIVANGTTRRWRFGGLVESTAADVPVAIDLGEVRIQLDGQHKFRHLDARGNTKLRSDMAGNLESHNQFMSYGIGSVAGIADNDFLFARGMRIGGTTFILLGARLLDTYTGRFISPDPIWNPINLFSYTLGNPVDFWDPGGASSEAIHTGRVFFSGLLLVGAVGGFVLAAPAVGSVAFVIGVISVTAAAGNFALALIEAKEHPNHGQNDGTNTPGDVGVGGGIGGPGGTGGGTSIGAPGGGFGWGLGWDFGGYTNCCVTITDLISDPEINP